MAVSTFTCTVDLTKISLEVEEAITHLDDMLKRIIPATLKKHGIWSTELHFKREFKYGILHVVLSDKEEIPNLTFAGTAACGDTALRVFFAFEKKEG